MLDLYLTNFLDISVKPFPPCSVVFHRDSKSFSLQRLIDDGIKVKTCNIRVVNVLSSARFKIYSSLTDAGDACSTRVRSRSRDTVAFHKSKRRISVGAGIGGGFSLAPRKNSFCGFTATHVRKSRGRVFANACVRQ